MKDPIAPLRSIRDELQQKVNAAQQDLQTIDRAIEMLAERQAPPKLLALPPPSKPQVKEPRRRARAASKAKAELAAKTSGRKGKLDGAALEKLKRLWGDPAFSVAEIAAELGVNDAAIYFRAKQLELPARPRIVPSNGHAAAVLQPLRLAPPAAKREDDIPPHSRRCVDCKNPFRSIDHAQDRCARCR